MPFGQAISTVFSKYAEFRGYARRSEFWWWILFTVLVSTALNVVPMWPTEVAFGVSTNSGLPGLWALAVLVPTLAVAVRRLRDAGYEWGHIFWLLLPVAGLIVLIVLCAQPGRGVALASSNGTGAAGVTSGP
jgi:uncharacterized membrane protein YhaH (DUF805 family)